MKFELDYPILGDDVVPVDEFIGWAFQFALGAAGAVALGVLIFGGIKYITSAGNPSGQGDAKKWIQDAILGLLLLLGSYLILNTINPDLVNINEPPDAAAPGLPQVSEAQYLNCLNVPSLGPGACGCVLTQSAKKISEGDPCVKPENYVEVVPPMISVCNNPFDTCVTRPKTDGMTIEVFCCNWANAFKP